MAANRFTHGLPAESPLPPIPTPPFELRHLRYFLAVAEDGSFGRAATRLYVAQPALSRQIRDLESLLGVRLFERSARGAELTGAGRLLLGDARHVYDAALAARARMRRAAEGEVGGLRIGLNDATLGNALVATALHRQRHAHGQVKLTLNLLFSGEQLEALRDGAIDAGFINGDPPQNELFAHLEIDRQRMGVALPSAHPLASRDTLALADLADQGFVLFPRSAMESIYDALLLRCRAAGFKPRVAHVIHGNESLLSLVRLGVGVGFVMLSQRERHMPGVVIRPVDGLDVDVGLNLVWLESNATAVLRNFVEVVETLLRECRSA